jgi:hypothetical protein
MLAAAALCDVVPTGRPAAHRRVPVGLGYKPLPLLCTAHELFFPNGGRGGFRASPGSCRPPTPPWWCCRTPRARWTRSGSESSSASRGFNGSDRSPPVRITPFASRGSGGFGAPCPARSSGMRSPRAAGKVVWHGGAPGSSAKLVPKREHPAEEAESRPLAPAVLLALAGDRSASLLGVADQRSSDVERSSK